MTLRDVPIDRDARIGFFLLAVGLIESAIAEGIDNENARIARVIGLRLLAETQGGDVAECQRCGEVCMMHKCAVSR